MSDWPVLPLSPDTDIRVIPNPRDDRAAEDAVERLWQDACARRPGLFNGRIFVADSITPERITGHWDEYRRAFAQMKAPELFRDSPLRQLAVCGILSCAEGVVAGRRAPPEGYLGGMWQTPPAGTVESRDGDDKADPVAQILAEAEEELGLLPDQIRVGQILFAVMHPETYVTDICLSLNSEMSFAETEKSWRACGCREYDRLALIRPDEIQAWLSRKDVVPTAQHMIRRMCD